MCFLINFWEFLIYPRYKAIYFVNIFSSLWLVLKMLLSGNMLTTCNMLKYMLTISWMTQNGDPPKFHFHLLVLISWAASLAHFGLLWARPEVGAWVLITWLRAGGGRGGNIIWIYFSGLGVPQLVSAGVCRVVSSAAWSWAPHGSISLLPLWPSSFTLRIVWMYRLLLGCCTGQARPMPLGHSGSGTLWPEEVHLRQAWLLASTSTFYLEQPLTRHCHPRLLFQLLGGAF